MEASDQHIASRVPTFCPPRGPNESYTDYAQRARAHRFALRRQFLDEYYAERQARLLSPHSDGDDDDQDSAEMAQYLEKDLYWDERPGEYFNYEYPVQHIEYDGPIGSLTDNEDDDIPHGIRPEEREWLVYLAERRRNGSLESETSQAAAATSGLKRKEVPEEKSGLRAPAKRTRVSTRSGTLRAAASGHKRKEIPEEGGNTQAPAKRTSGGTRAGTLQAATSGHKRKKAPEDVSDLQAPAKRTKVGTRAETLRAAAQGHKRKRAQEEDGDLATRIQAVTKKRRTDTRPQPAVKQPGGKRKRDFDEQQTFQAQGGPEAKRRRVGKDAQPLQLQTSASPGPSPVAATNPGESKLDSVSAVKEMSPRPKQTSRVTRAQRLLLSGKDTQLFQLGQRGELDVQVPASHKDASKNTAGKLRSARTGTETGSSTKSGRQNKRGRKGRC